MAKEPGALLSVAPRLITRIEVDALFGEYDYELGSSDDSTTDQPRLFLIYGDNGAGKTTILGLLFNLLSTAERRGHRTYVARVPFRRFAVHLSDGTTITAFRQQERLTGSYAIVVARGTEVLLDIQVEAEANGRVPGPPPASLLAYLSFLAELDLGFFYLSDDRRLRRSLSEGDEENLSFHSQREMERLLIGHASPTRANLVAEGERTLISAIERFEGWVRDQSIRASNTSEASTNNIYAEIIRRIARPGKARKSKRTIEELVVTLEELQFRAETFSNLGLISPLSFRSINDALAAARGPTKEIIVGVIGPYVDSISARLNALEELQSLLTTFVDSVSSFLYDKRASFELGNGLRITSIRSGQTLDPSVLSSGERQLLLLFCNTVLAREQSSVVIIDEPEISLNVKWQRRLLQSLLALTEDSSVQFVIATHSLELLARYRKSVWKLEDKRNVETHD